MSRAHIQLVSRNGDSVYVERALLEPCLTIKDLPSDKDSIDVPFSLQQINMVVRYCNLVRSCEETLPVAYARLEIEPLQEQIPEAYYNFITTDISCGDSAEAKSGQRLRDFYDVVEWFDIPELMELIKYKVASLYVNKSYKELKEWGLLFTDEIDEEKKQEIEDFEILNTYYTIDLDERPARLIQDRPYQTRDGRVGTPFFGGRRPAHEVIPGLREGETLRDALHDMMPDIYGARGSRCKTTYTRHGMRSAQESQPVGFTRGF